MKRYRFASFRRHCILCTSLAFFPFAGTQVVHAAAEVAQISVDAREASRGILQAHLRLPVTAGALTLVYPKWLPGRHSPAGPITSLGGPRLFAHGAPLQWRRDDLDPYSFHVEIPSGVTALEADLEIVTSPAPDGIVQGLETPRSATESLAIVEWNQLVLYPAGLATDSLVYQASIRVPAGWRFAAALTIARAFPDGAEFAPVSLTTLVDSTLLAGRYLQTFDLGGTPSVQLQIAPDRPGVLVMTAQILQHYRDLVREAALLFGSAHYRSYQFLWALTDQIMPDGLEHHESSDDRSPLRALVDDDIRRAEANLLPHEYVHSWNGKYRRPIGLATPDYQTPMRDELLWVYEGLTEYLGDVLAVRSGLLTVQEFRDELARIAAAMDSHAAREWRSLQDTTVAAPLLYYQSRDWAARLRRQDDFYQESALLWLEVDTVIRRESHGHKSLDDFCRLFYGGPNEGPQLHPYDFDAVVAALQSVHPYDWRAFWLERLNRTRKEAPLEGLRSAGWRFALTQTPTSLHVAHETEDRDVDLRYSIGFLVDLDHGTIADVIPGSPADRAGAAPGSKLIAVNGHKWSKDVLQDTLTREAGSTRSVSVLVEKDDEYRTLELHDVIGERYPVLEREPDLPDLLEAIAKPLGPTPH